VREKQHGLHLQQHLRGGFGDESAVGKVHGRANFSRLEFPQTRFPTSASMKTSLANLVLCAAALALPPLAAHAQDTSRCTDKNGKKHYGNTIPPQCQNRAVEQLNSQGLVIKRFDPEATEREKAAAEKNKAEKEKLDAINRETQRRDRALLA